MRQGKDAGALYEELLIANYDLEKQAAANQLYLYEQSSQLTQFDFKCDYMEDVTQHVTRFTVRFIVHL